MKQNSAMYVEKYGHYLRWVMVSEYLAPPVWTAIGIGRRPTREKKE